MHHSSVARILVVMRCGNYSPLAQESSATVNSQGYPFLLFTQGGLASLMFVAPHEPTHLEANAMD